MRVVPMRRLTLVACARRLLAGLVVAVALAPLAGHAAEDAACRTVRFADIGATDTTATTALFAHLVHELGYTPAIAALSPPDTYASLKNHELDVYLGNWMPAQGADRKPYVDDRSVEVIGANLEGAKYTLAVPDYAWDAGLKDFADIGRFAAPLKRTIYGIEPGNDGNRLVLKIIEENRFGLGGFKLVESSQQGMLAEVERAVRSREPIVFLAWAPPKFGPKVSSPPVRYLRLKRMFIGCGAQARNTIGSPKRTARSTSDSMPCSLDSTSLKPPRPKRLCSMILRTSRLPSAPGSMP